ncbi:MAG TPA: hypothetical protein VJR93_00065 [Chthoniobacterales bacterium]|nr:hypothetical protein [Chthoniobacterales bacterium]
MPFDKFHDIEEITDARRKAVAVSIRTIEVGELKKLGEQIFDSPDHPWRGKFLQLIENPGATFYHADAGNGVNFLYDSTEDKGLWYLPGNGMGPLSATGRQIMKEAMKR